MKYNDIITINHYLNTKKLSSIKFQTDIIIVKRQHYYF